MLIEDILNKLTLEEKASLCSGKDFWHLKSLDRLNIPSIMMCDGPHGLRKQSVPDAQTGLTQSLKATCFPTASTTANSWDTRLITSIAEAIAEEALSEEVSVILAPGTNIKRSPLCGRNFEYYSEDPFLSGKLAAAFIIGLQNKGIGATLKHFACNNQETKRMTINSVVDKRALYEIYLLPFEIAIKEGKPWLLMTSYNKLNNDYCSENELLLTNILREKWGFEGVVISDWGATNNRVLGLKSGLDLEMPSSYGYNDKKIIKAIKNGDLSIDVLNKSAKRILELIAKATSFRRETYTFSQEEHHLLAYKAATKSLVLLKNNNNILPLNTASKILVLGELAENIRYQGSGSSAIDPFLVENILTELTKSNVNFQYGQGYSISANKILPMLIYEACSLAKEADTVLIFAGLTEEYESEGFDRTHLSLPDNQIALIESISTINKNLIVILFGGSAINLNWDDENISGLLYVGLSGEAGASAIVNTLLGKEIPSGKLTETFPLALSHTPGYNNFPGGPKTVEYRESIYVGYRYYDKSKTSVKYPFGHGLSYSEFSYSNLKSNKTSINENDILSLSINIKNIGLFPAEEIVQLYVHCKGSKIFRPEKELKGFTKVYILPNETVTTDFTLSKRDFSYYNTIIDDWCIEPGYYDILIGSSSRNIREKLRIQINPTTIVPSMTVLSSYVTPTKNGLAISKEDFETLYNAPLPLNQNIPGQPYTLNSTLGEIKHTLIGKKVYDLALEIAYSMFPNGKTSPILNKMITAVTEDFPIRNLVTLSNGKFSPHLANTLIKMMNEDYLKSLITMIQNNIRY